MSITLIRFLVDHVREPSRIFLTVALISVSPSVFGEPNAPSETPLHVGSVWKDDAGQSINAHGGGILFHEGRYYWYGEMKSGPTQLPESNKSWNGTRVDFSGVSCYVSTDLLHWHFEGVALPSNNDPASELGHHRVVERPKVIYNHATRRFVMWMHIDSADYLEARGGVAVSESPTGPFVYLGSRRPDAGHTPQNMPATLRAEFAALKTDAQRISWGIANKDWAAWARDFTKGQMLRDMNLFVDGDGRAYLIYASEENAVLHISRLSDDYLTESGTYVRAIDGSREAPAVFKHRDKYYMVNSGCTGWVPNTLHFFTADAIFGPWTDLGSGITGTKEEEAISFHSQPTFVLTLPGKDTPPIYLGDRWLSEDLEKSTYVWLPINMNGPAPKIAWQSEWRLPTLPQN